MKKENRWHLMASAEVIDRLGTNEFSGLTSADAKSRLAHGGENGIWKVKRASFAGYTLEVLSDLATALLVAAAIIAAIFGDVAEALAIAVIVAVGSVMRIAVYMKAQRMLEALAKNVIPKTRVIRDGKAMMVSSEKIVPGDIMLFTEGDTVPCDCRILSEVGLTANEDSITENVGAVKKTADAVQSVGVTPVEERCNMLFAATTVASGEARCVACATGASTYVVARHGGLVIRAGEGIPLIKKLNSWCGKGSLVFLAAAIVIAFVSLIKMDGTYSAATVFLSAISFAVAALSESFGSIVTMILASSMKEASPEAVIKDGAMVETIADCDVILLSSTATLTSGETSVVGYELAGNRVKSGEASAELDQMLELAYLSTGAAFSSASVGYKSDSASALRAVCEKHKSKQFTQSPIGILAYLPSADASSAGVNNTLITENGSNTLIVSGMPEKVLSFCTSCITAQGEVILSSENKAAIMSRIYDEEKSLSSVIAFATVTTENSNLTRLQSIRAGMTYVGYIAVADPITKGVPSLISDLRRSGTSFVLFTDGSEYDRKVAEKCGIFTVRDRYIGARESAELRTLELSEGESALVELPRGMNAEVKTAVAEYIRESGRVSAYIATDFADTAAMASSDVAMATIKRESLARVPLSLLTGADVLLHPKKESGGLFLAVRAIAYSKNVFANIRSAVSYMLTSQCAVTVMMLSAAFFGTPLPNSVFLLFFGMTASFLAMLSMAFRLPKNDIITKKRRHIELNSPAEIAVQIGIGFIWGVVTVIATAIAGSLTEGATPYSGASAMLVSLLLTSLVCAFENGAVPDNRNASPSFIVAFAALVSVITAAILLARFSPSVLSLIEGELMSPAQFISAFAAPVVTLIAYEVAERIK